MRDFSIVLTYIYHVIPKGYRRYFWGVIGVSALCAVILALSPYLLALITNYVSTESKSIQMKTIPHAIFYLSFFYLITLLVSKVGFFVTTKLQSYLRIGIIKTMSAHYLSEIYAADIKSICANSGEKTQRLNQATNDVYIIIRSLAQNILAPVIQIMMALGVVVGTGDAFSGALFLVYILCFFSLNLRYANKLSYSSKRVMDVSIKTYGILSDSVDNIIAAKKNNGFEQLISRYHVYLNDEDKVQQEYWRINTRMLLVNALLGFILFGVVFVYSLFMVLNSSVSVGHFIMISSYIYLLSSPVESIGSLFTELKQASATLIDFIEYLSNNEQKSPQSTLPVDNPAPENYAIDFKSVFFSYTAKDNRHFGLQDVSLSIKPGDHVIITGPSGSGKSTVGKLIAKYFSDYRGDVLLGGINIKQIDDSRLNDLVYMVSQDESIFMDNVRFNLLIANQHATDKEMEHALKMVNLFDIHGRKIDLGSDLGDRGNNLSGGQRQRLSLARLFLRHPKVILIDEATSVLDYQNEKTIFDRIRAKFPHATIVTITHKSLLLTTADYLFILDHGKVVNHGTFEHLIKHDRYLQAMVASTAIAADNDMPFRRLSPTP